MTERGFKGSLTKRPRIIVSSSEDEDDDFQDLKFEKKKEGQVSTNHPPASTNSPNVMIENSVSEKDESEKSDASNADDVPSKIYICTLCPSYSCAKRGTMFNHLHNTHRGAEIDGKKLTATQCLVTDKLKIKEMQSKSKETYKFPCTHQGCQRGYENEKSLKSHITSHSDKYKYCCTVCGRLEKITGLMRKHYVNNHQYIPFDFRVCANLMDLLKEEAERNGTKVEQPVYSCRLCEKSFEFPNLLKQHLSKHDLAPRTCTICGKIFKTPTSCHIHTRMHDVSFVQFQCTKGNGCTQRFATAHHLRTHEEFAAIHNPEPKLECDKCQRKFCYPNQLKRHQRNPCPAPKQEPRYRCKIETCKRGFHKEKNLKKHEERHDNGTLNLQIPPDDVMKMYRRMINACTEQVYIDSCNKNKPKGKAGCRLVVVPCNHLLEDGTKCQKKAVMFTSAETPCHHIRMLLNKMMKGDACTSLHSHCEGEGHEMDVAAAHFVDGGVDNYEMQMVKKMVVKMAKKETPVIVTNHTEYEIYHLYDESAITEVIKIMRDEGLTSKTEDHLRADITVHLDEVLNGGKYTVRKHRPLVFKDNLFQFSKKEALSSADEGEAERDMLDALAEDEDDGSETEDMSDEVDEEE